MYNRKYAEKLVVMNHFAQLLYGMRFYRSLQRFVHFDRPHELVYGFMYHITIFDLTI